MFCSNCGKQIPDNTKFCNHCGAQQQIVEGADSAPKTTENQKKIADIQPQESKKIPKKKTNIFIGLAVVLCAFILGKFVIAPSMVSDSGKENDTGNQGSQSQPTTENNSGSSVGSENSAYDAIFDDTYIVHFQTFFNMGTENFAMKEDDGTIYCMDYGYKDDVIKQVVETVYIPISEYTDTQKAEIETTMKTRYASVDALNCCVVTYKMSTNYYTITCTYSDMDQPSNYSEMYNAGFLSKNTFFSMSETETSLLGQGFIKK